MMPDPIQHARRQHALLMVELYCENPACSAREIQVRIKDHDDLLKHKTPALTCPFCQRPVKVHWAMPRREWTDEQDRQARMNVNMQMYVRDKSPMVPAMLMMDDRLPPTPAGWFDVREHPPAKRPEPVEELDTSF